VPAQAEGIDRSDRLYSSLKNTNAHTFADVGILADSAREGS